MAQQETSITRQEKHLLDVLLAMSTGSSVILEGAMKEDQVGEPAGVPVRITPIKDGGFVVQLHNGDSAYYNMRKSSF